MKAAVIDWLLEFPELRSAVVVFDWHGALNGAQVQKGLWLGRRGGQLGMEELIGGLNQNFGMLQSQLFRLSVFGEGLKREALESAKQLAEATQRLHDAQNTTPSQNLERPAPAVAAGQVT